MLLSQCDFKPNESKVYLGMLQSGFTTPAKIARYCELPRQKIYRVLEDLVSKGACTMLAEPRRKYIPVNPNILVKRARRRIEVLIEESEDLAKELEELFNENSKNQTPQDNVTILVDPVRVAELLGDMMENVKEEILVYSTVSKIVPVLKKLDKDRFIELNERFRANMERAVTEDAVTFFSIVSKQDINRSALIYKTMEHPDLDNVQVRLVDSIPCRLQIYDRETVIIGIKNDLSHKYTIKTLCIRDAGLASLLSKGFHALYSEAETIEEAGIEELLDECRVDFEEWKKLQKEDS